LGGSRMEDGRQEDESVASWMSAASWNRDGSEAGESVWSLAGGREGELDEDGWSDVGGGDGSDRGR
jgi:hypothetical protein